MKLLPTLCLFLLCGIASAMPSDPHKTASQHSENRMEHPIKLPFSDDVTAVLWRPDLTAEPVKIHNGLVSLPKPHSDNYHALVAEQITGNSRSTYIRYLYRHGKPSGHSPSELMALPKTALEIIPAPIPREHNRYYSAQAWSFLIHYQKQALVDHKAILRTSNGSELEQITDENGRVTFVLPDDFPDVSDGNRDQRQAAFKVLTHHSDAGQQFDTELAANYSINTAHWKYTGWGVFAILCGLISGRSFISFKQKPVSEQI